MRLLKNRSLRLYLVFFLILTVSLGGSTIAAFADQGPATVGVTGASNVTETGAATGATATPVTLNGTEKNTTYTLQLPVNDDTGTGNGWNLTFAATTFSTGAT